MKNIIFRIFLLLCASVFVVESIALFMVRLGYFSPGEASVFYSALLQDAGRMDILLGAAASFLLLGVILMLRVFWGAGSPRAIVIKEKGEAIRIPIKTIREFIDQTIEQNSSLEDAEIAIKKKGKWIDVRISCAYTGDNPVREEMNRIKEVLKNDMKKVFNFPYVKINYQLEGISIEKTEGMNSDVAGSEKRTEEGSLALTQEIDADLDDKEVFGEDVLDGKADKGEAGKVMPWDK